LKKQFVVLMMVNKFNDLQIISKTTYSSSNDGQRKCLMKVYKFINSLKKLF